MSKDYTAIPGLGIGRGSFQIGMRRRLYQGSDHLLLIQGTGYAEDYRRVFYRDIHYVLARENFRYFWFNVIFGLFALGFLALYFTEFPEYIVLIIASVVFGICLIVNLAKGSSCDCYVVTNVQMLVMPTPQRLKKVPVLIEFLKTKVPSLESETAPS